jgi:hypothetical protein
MQPVDNIDDFEFWREASKAGLKQFFGALSLGAKEFENKLRAAGFRYTQSDPYAFDTRSLAVAFGEHPNQDNGPYISRSALSKSAGTKMGTALRPRLSLG